MSAKRSTRQIRSMVLALAAMAAISTVSQAAPVTWSTPGNITGDTDVVTTGTLERAYNFHNADATLAPTVNGVVFASFAVTTPAGGDVISTYSSQTVGDTTLSTTAGSGIGAYNGLDSAATPFSALSGGYQDLLKSAVFDAYTTPAIEPLTLTLASLTSGTPYVFQAWVNDSRNIGAVWTRTVTVTSGNVSGALDFNVGNADGGLGQYVVGTFTADSTSQVFTFQGDSSTQIQAFQLRSVPEPTALAVLSLSGLALMRRRR